MTTNKLIRKATPIARGVLDYFPDAIAAVAHVSYIANEQHNPGEEMHWNRGKSRDHADALVRHLLERGTVDDDGLHHSAKVAWRALALLQVEIEQARESQASPLSLDDIRRKHENLWAGPTDQLDPLSEAADYGAELEPALDYREPLEADTRGGVSGYPLDDNNPLPTVEEMSQSIDDEAIQAAGRQMERLGLIDHRDDHTAECACAKKRLAIEEKTLTQLIASEEPEVAEQPASLPENVPNPASTPIEIHVTFWAIANDTLAPNFKGYNTSGDGFYFTIEEEVYFVEPHQSMIDGGRTDPRITKSAHHADIFGGGQTAFIRIDKPVWGFIAYVAFIKERANAYVAEHYPQ